MTSLPHRLALLLAAILAALAPFAGWPASGHAQGIRHDNRLPIEITADTLEVLQNERIATFAGNVDAVQGDFVLSADTLRVHYRGSDEGVPGTDQNDIRRIEADGSVILTSPRETAQGDTGVYDVAAQTVTLEGSVVLTREENVIRGQRLEMDLATGRSRVLAAATSREGAQPGERVRAIFAPSQDRGAPSQDRGQQGGAREEQRPARPAQPEGRAQPEERKGSPQAAGQAQGAIAAAAANRERGPSTPGVKAPPSPPAAKPAVRE